MSRTTHSVCGSGTRRCIRLPSEALAGLGCGPTSSSMYPYGGRPPSQRPSIWAWEVMAARTRVLMRVRSPLEIPPYIDMISSWASFAGSIAPPISGTQSWTL
ncbi:hypothetical protein LP52_18675 [Streptomonospora alba]|uniref:Uncharacterized protein n=1 Tax=Streptomonospora alba TaxID=183763 RepID=A0A0C2G2M5_9ACTN|nr:hypothetical protein LP52_18675 [Streptomonospora alba]